MLQQFHLTESKNAVYIRLKLKWETNNKRFALNFKISLLKCRQSLMFL